MFGHHPQITPVVVMEENTKLKQQLNEVMSRKPTTELEKVLMTENLALKSEVEQLKMELENERKAQAENLLWARLNGIGTAASIYKMSY